MADANHANEETGRSRAQRIRLDYYRHRGSLYWWRWGLAALGLLLAGSYVGLISLTDAPAKHLSTGPLALAHASFEQDCEKCHQPLTPVAGDAWQPDPDQAVAALAAACRNCHSVDGHHHAHLNAVGARLDDQCSLCHREHQGREHRLVSLSDDAACLQCHADLEAVRTTGRGEPLKSQIEAFTAESHGEFASLRTDTGRVRFDHAQHLRPGQVEPGQRGGFRLDMLAPADAARYRRGEQADDALVQLDCASCHAFAGAASAAVNAADRDLGRYPEPIRFDRHCAACHSLTHRGQSSEQLPLPHAAPWEEIASLLRAKIASGRLQGELRMPRDAVPGQALPGTVADTAEAVAPAAAVLAGEMEQALASVRARCLQCHLESDVTAAAIAKAKRQAAPLIPDRWLRRGLFDHAAHPGLHCAFCHAEAYPELPAGLPEEVLARTGSAETGGPAGAAAPENDSADHRQVMIRGIESCTPCHRDVHAATPAALAKSAAEGLLGATSSWASASCTTCHRYHWSRPGSSGPAEEGSAETGSAETGSAETKAGVVGAP